MKNEATEGPWEARPAIPDVYVGKGVISYRPGEGLTASAIPATVVRIYRDDQDRRCTQFLAECNSANADNNANAALMAAAPELLVGAKWARAFMEQMAPHGVMPPDWPYQQIKAAIRKAEDVTSGE